MAKSTFKGPLRTQGAIQHVSVAAGTGTETVTTIVDASGVLVAAPTTTEPLSYSNATTITAGTTQTQAGATALTEEFNNVTVCATDGDGVKLPTAVAGLSIKVKNSGATSLAVYPATGDSINALAVNLSVNVPVGGVVTFNAISATVWETQEVFVSHAPTTQRGEFVFKAVDNDGDTVTTLSNAAMAQASVISIPDPGAATANILLTSQANDQSLVTATATELNILDGVTATAAELNQAADQSANILTAGAGFTDGVGALHYSAVEKHGNIFKTTIFLDLTGTGSSTTDLDIIGSGASAAHIGQVTAALNGTIFFGTMTCVELPVTGVTDIDLYSATEGTGAFDSAVTALTETALLTKGGVWTAAVETPVVLSALPAANEYLYLTCGAGGVPGTYTAGQYIIELWGA